MLWSSCCILSEAISNYPLLFISSLFDTFWPEGLIFQCHLFLPFHNIYGVLAARILEEIPISSFSGPCFARILQMTCPFLVALHGMANSLIELCETHCRDSAVTMKRQEALRITFFLMHSIYSPQLDSKCNLSVYSLIHLTDVEEFLLFLKDSKYFFIYKGYSWFCNNFHKLT